MRATDGGFYSALDADSADGEGYYYTWTPAEVRAVLKPALAESAIAYFNVSTPGNFDGRTAMRKSSPLGTP